MVRSTLSKLMVVAILLIASLASQGQAPSASSSSDAELRGVASFGTVVQRNWPAWSQGKPTVDKLDLVAEIAKPEYKGENAAALVALEVYLRKVPSADMSTAAAINDPKILKIYHDNILKLQRAKRTLFASGRPTFGLLQQGPSGDCYFFSATGWIASNRPSDITRAISQQGDGYHVRFPNGNEASVTAPTDSELAINDSDSTLQDGLWMSVLEKATGVIQSKTIPRSADIPDPTVRIDIAGVPIASTVRRWSGREVRSFVLGRRARRKIVRNELIRMHNRKSLATALLLHRPPADLPYDHVYAIMDFNAGSNTVTIWNPWGTDFTPRGPSGPQNGFTRDKGIFTLSLNQFITYYTALAVEQN